MPCNVALPSFIEAIERIEASVAHGGQLFRPCSLTLKDGRKILRAICAEEAKGFETDVWIHPETVIAVEECPFRMPAKLANKLYKAGESGMGYEIFVMDLRSGEDLLFVTPNIVDFPDLPPGMTTQDIKAVHPHRGRERTKTESYRGLCDFSWCFYVRPEKA